MPFEVKNGPRGPSPTWDGRLLLSAYAPEKEAQTWVAGLEVGPGALVFVAGDPLGGAAAALTAQGVKAVALVPGPEASAWVPPGVVHWSPGAEPLEGFLRDIFDQWGPDGVVWQVWPAFERLAPDLALDWSRRFRDLYRTVQGSWLTQHRFGPRTWRNALRNFLDWDHPADLVPGTKPLVIAASGPSLDDGLGLLKKHRAKFDLWALPSSFETLVRRGLAPDAGVATDGGYYAREHLHRLANTEVPVLGALSSAPDPVLRRRRCHFFSQGLAWEQGLLGSVAQAYTEVPSQGTVAVSALRLALEATSGPVFIAGLDLAFRDLRGHTSPHTVDRRLERLQGRLTPIEGLWAERLFEQATVVQGGTRTSQALLTYAGWFRTRARFARPVYRIAPSELRWDSMTNVSWAEAEALWTRGSGTQGIRWVDRTPIPRDGRRAAAQRALQALEDRVQRTQDDDPWLVDLARTAVPAALAEEYRARRTGAPTDQLKTALQPFLSALGEKLR